jgi:hypothetical protein
MNYAKNARCQIALLAVLLLSAGGCKPKKPIGTAAEDAQGTADRNWLFQKKLECSNFLTRIAGSTLGPERKFPHGQMMHDPIVFYSPKLNTCIYVQGSTSDVHNKFTRQEFRNEDYYVQDLLTGHSIESVSFDLQAAKDVESSKTYLEELIKKYGGQVP